MKKLILSTTLFPILFLALGAAGAVTYTGSFVGDGSGLTNVNGANVTGFVPLATTALTASNATNNAQGVPFGTAAASSTNQFATPGQLTAATNGLETVAHAAATYYPTSNPSGFISSVPGYYVTNTYTFQNTNLNAGIVITNGWLVWVGTNLPASGGGVTNWLNNFNTVFVSPLGSDANAGTNAGLPTLSISNAITKARSYWGGSQFILKLDYGVTFVSSYKIDCTNMAIVGSGRTQIYTNLPGGVPITGTNGTIIALDGLSGICLGDNSLLDNFTLWQTSAGQHPISTMGGIGSNAGDHSNTNYLAWTTTNCAVMNVTAFGVLIHTVMLESSNLVQVYFENDNFITYRSYDALAMLYETVQGSWVVCKNCYLANGIAYTTDAGQTLSIGTNYNVWWNGGAISRTGSFGATNACIGIVATNSTLTIGGTSVYGIGSNGSHHDLYIASTSTNCSVTVNGLCLNPSLVINNASSTACPVTWDGWDSYASLVQAGGVVTNYQVIDQTVLGATVTNTLHFVGYITTP